MKKNRFSLLNILLYLVLFFVVYYTITCINHEYYMLEGFGKRKTASVGQVLFYLVLFLLISGYFFLSDAPLSNAINQQRDYALLSHNY